jgi:hypothetical protein
MAEYIGTDNRLQCDCGQEYQDRFYKIFKYKKIVYGVL